MTDKIKDELIDYPDAGPTHDAAQLRAEIEETRSEMSETIDAIQDMLSPEHIKEQVLEKVHDATIGQVEHMAHAAMDKISPTVEMVEDKFEEAVKKLGQVSGPMVQTARDQGARLASRVRRQPLAAAGVAVVTAALFWGLKTRKHGWKI